jgi:membrane protein DedA with SNARE-associated domain
MSSIPTGVLIYFSVSTLVAALVHWRIKRYLIACGVSAAIGPISFAVVSALAGESPYIPEAKVAVFFAVISLIISAFVGLAFFIPRRFAQQTIPADRPKTGSG